MSEADVLHQILNQLKSNPNLTEIWDSYPTATPPPSPWVNDVSGITTLAVDDTVFYGAVGKSCKMHAGDLLTHSRLSRQGLTLSHRYMVETRLRAHGTAGSHSRSLQLVNHAGGYVNVPAQVDFHSDSNVYAQNAGAPVVLGGYAVDTWYRVCIDFDDDAHNYHAYYGIGRFPIIGEYSSGIVAPADEIDFASINGGNDLYADEVSVFTQDWYDGFDALIPPAPPAAPWTCSTAGGGTIVSDPVNHEPNSTISAKLDAAGGGGTARLFRTVAWAPGAIHKLDFFMSFSAAAGNHQTGLRIRNAAAQVQAQIVAHNDGHMYYWDGAGWVDLGVYVAANFYHFELYDDGSSGRYYFYMDGTRYPAAGYAVPPNGGSPVDACFFSENVNAQVWADTVFSGMAYITETFDAYPTGSAPPAPWITDISGIASSLIDAVVRHGTAGKSLKLHSADIETYARSIQAFTFPLLTKGTMWLYPHGATGATARGFKCIATGTGHIVFEAYVHNDGHLYALDGAVPRDLGVIAPDAWSELIIHLNISAHTWTLEYAGVTWPAVASYAATNAEVPDSFKIFSDFGGSDLYIDDIVLADEEFVPGIIFTNDFPHITPVSPMVVALVASYGHGYAWAGLNSSGKLGMLRPTTVDLAILIPWFESTQDIKLDSTEGKLLDAVAKYVRNNLIRNQLSLVNFIDVSIVQSGKTSYIQSIDCLARMYTMKFKDYEEV